MADPLQLAALTTLTALAQFLPEREAHPRIYDAMRLVIDRLEEPAIWPALLVRWELGLLDELGFGLDLGRCAVTGSTENLIYVSPRTGRAVSRSAGEAYRDKLLSLPEFLRGSQGAALQLADILAGFELTGHFLSRHIFEPRGATAPQSRSWMLTQLAERPH